MTKLKAALTAAAFALSTPASAQNVALQYDWQALSALDLMYQTLGSYCLAGDPVGCQATQYVADLGGFLWNASHGCEMGDPWSCQSYVQAYWQLDSDFGAFNAYFGQLDYSAYGSTHEERLFNIRAHGQAILAEGRGFSAIQEQRQQDFLAYLRQ